MKRKYRYKINEKVIEREISYIPVRYILAMMLTVFEILAVFGIVTALCYFVPYFYIAAYITSVGCIVSIIASDDIPEYKLPWVLLVLFVPIAGFMSYLMFYSRKLRPRYLKRLEQVYDMSYRHEDEQPLAALAAENKSAATQASLLCKIAGTHLFQNTAQTYFPLGEEMHAALLDDLRRAERFIYMEYFIIEEGRFWNSILEILTERAAAGVEVKVLYDDIGCMSTLPGDYYKQLQKRGIDALPFSRVRGGADGEINNRSHRKITVIDGAIGYTGGVNLADEYINAVTRFGHWKDTALRLEGEGVRELTRLFLADFGLNAKRLPALRADSYPPCEREAAGYVVPFGDGPRPIYPRRVGKCVIQSILGAATDYVYMTTPYLIIDNDLCSDIENAALRGVDVRIITPHIPDKKLVFALTRSFYPRLLAAGVKIYEYTPGFIHAKSYIADDRYGMIGTINLDYRSLVHHFENGVWMYGTDSVLAIKQDIEKTLELCTPITPDQVKTKRLARFFRSVGRLFAPML